MCRSILLVVPFLETLQKIFWQAPRIGKLHGQGKNKGKDSVSAATNPA